MCEHRSLQQFWAGVDGSVTAEPFLSREPLGAGIDNLQTSTSYKIKVCGLAGEQHSAPLGAVAPTGNPFLVISEGILRVQPSIAPRFDSEMKANEPFYSLEGPCLEHVPADQQLIRRVST